MPNSSLFYKWIPFEGSIENPLILLHGFLETHKIWYNLPLEQLKRPLLLLDISGFGKSPMLDNQAPSIAYYASEIDKILKHYSVSSCQVIGHSMGGYIGLELLQINLAVKKVVLLNSNFWNDSALKKKDRTRVADLLLKAKNLFINEAIPALFIDKIKSKKFIFELSSEAKLGTAEWYAYAALAMRDRKDFTAYLQKNPHQVEIIHGEYDNLVSIATLAEKCGDWKSFSIIENTGHMSLFEEPKKVVSTILNLLH